MGRTQWHAGHRGGALPDAVRAGQDLNSSASPSGARPSPNLWHHPVAYETENRAFDRAGHVWATLQTYADWAGRDVLDVGCGAGFHLPTFAATAAAVVGVEPHGPLARIARRRTRALANVDVREGSAEALPLAAASVDVVHARWAYFFGPGCEPGLAELDRVVRPGGRAFVIDNDPTTSTYGGWFRRGFPSVDPALVEAFWRDQGWERARVLTAWDFEDHAGLEDVVRIELPTAVAAGVLAAHPTTTHVDYAVNIWTKGF